LWTDSRFATPHLRATLRLRTTADWLAILHQQHIPCGSILNLQQVFADPQVRHNGMVFEHHHPTAGHRRLLGFPLRLSEAPVDIHFPALALGEHTEALLTGLGYSPERIEKLRRDEVL
jgi:crotonobetainyl-CoA:carnitine CoA-transferase CaiB-like acyl-CoA transferase